MSPMSSEKEFMFLRSVSNLKRRRESEKMTFLHIKEASKASLYRLTSSSCIFRSKALQCYVKNIYNGTNTHINVQTILMAIKNVLCQSNTCSIFQRNINIFNFALNSAFI